MKSAKITYPDFEQSFMFEECSGVITIPEAGLIALSNESGQVIFYDDEYPTYDNNVKIYESKDQNESR